MLGFYSVNSQVWKYWSGVCHSDLCDLFLDTGSNFMVFTKINFFRVLFSKSFSHSIGIKGGSPLFFKLIHEYFTQTTVKGLR